MLIWINTATFLERHHCKTMVQMTRTVAIAFGLLLIILCGNGMDAAATRARRSLRALKSTTGNNDNPSINLDLKSVEDKYKLAEGDEDGEAQYKLDILALGGSVTWGAQLQHRNESYPYVIKSLYEDIMGDDVKIKVDNLAIRATGADYPSVCIQSMVEEANPDEPDKSYDLILLDFALNGIDGFPQLLKRLRLKYPDAVIIFIELWSLLSTIEEKGTSKRVFHLGKDPSVNWTWRSGDSIALAEMKALVASVGGYVYEFVRPETPSYAIERKWFAERDWHHLSAKGHDVLANDLLNSLEGKQNRDMFKKSKRVGTWGMGDQCYNWFLSGHTDPVEYHGANIENLYVNMVFANTKAKWTLQFDPISGGTIELYSRYSKPVPIGLGYMSREEPADYPVIDISVNEDDAISIDPKINRSTFPDAHITLFAQLGMAKPGRNVITITPAEVKSDPFRVVGVYLCGACAEVGNLRSDEIDLKDMKNKNPTVENN